MGGYSVLSQTDNSNNNNPGDKYWYWDEYRWIIVGKNIKINIISCNIYRVELSGTYDVLGGSNIGLFVSTLYLSKTCLWYNKVAVLMILIEEINY